MSSYLKRNDRTNSSNALNSSSGQENSSKKMRSPDFRCGAKVARTKSVDLNMSASKLITMRPDRLDRLTKRGNASWNSPTSKLQRGSLISGSTPFALKCPAGSVGRHLSGNPVNVSKPTNREVGQEIAFSHSLK